VPTRTAGGRRSGSLTRVGRRIDTRRYAGRPQLNRDPLAVQNNMDALNQTELRAFFATTRLAVADPSLGIGREISFRQSARRLIVIHFGKADRPDYIARTISIVLSSQPSWLLVARFGPAAKLGTLTTLTDAEALSFGPGERERLCTYLCTRDMTMGSVSQDVYAIGVNGNTLVTWDHHTHDEGLRVDLQDVQESSKLLAALNTFGAELEVFYTDG